MNLGGVSARGCLPFPVHLSPAPPTTPALQPSGLAGCAVGVHIHEAFEGLCRDEVSLSFQNGTEAIIALLAQHDVLNATVTGRMAKETS